MNVIYVDDEEVLLENFRLTAQELTDIDTLDTFQKGEDALLWVKENPVDVAFLDVEMPGMNGIRLAKKLNEADENIRIVFVTAFEQYALQAFGVDAIGYLLKPYNSDDIEKELKKAARIASKKEKEIQIRTMPDLMVMVRGNVLPIRHTKQEELLALLIDKGEVGITKGEAIACLWEGQVVSDSSYWKTMSRLNEILEKAGVPDLILTNGHTKRLNTSLVDCDLYRMLSGDRKAIEEYAGSYLKHLSWAEERNAQLFEIKKNYTKNYTNY